MLGRFFILLIRGYKYFISPLLGSNCRFHPSCSEYCQDCLKKFSLPKALWYSCRRILKCHPFHSGGYDPVP